MAANDTPQMRADFLKAMRNVANSVTVVTTDGPGGKQGATVSSFCSVSADPPTLLVCLHSESRIYQAVSTNKCFCINVLPQNLAHTAQRFAGFHDKEIEDRFAGIETDPTIDGPSIISKATSFTCALDHMVSSGTHGVFIAHVTDISNGDDDPLIYLNGSFRKIDSKE